MYCCMVLFGDLCQEIIAFKLITFGADWLSVFQGIRIGVIVQSKEDNAPVMISVHCISHHTYLTIQFFFKMGIVKKIENVL